MSSSEMLSIFDRIHQRCAFRRSLCKVNVWRQASARRLSSPALAYDAFSMFMVATFRRAH
jgi:hypothetical protein